MEERSVGAEGVISQLTGTELFDEFLTQKQRGLTQSLFDTINDNHLKIEQQILLDAQALDPPMRASFVRMFGRDDFDERKFRFYLFHKSQRLVAKNLENYIPITDLMWQQHIQPGLLEPRTGLWGRSALVDFIPYVSEYAETATWIVTDTDRLKRANDVDQQVGHIIIQTTLMGFNHFCRKYLGSLGFVPNLGGGDEGISFIPGRFYFDHLKLTNDINSFIAQEVPSIESLVGRETIFGEPLMIRHNQEKLTPSVEVMEQWLKRASQLNDNEVLTRPPTLTAASEVVNYQQSTNPVRNTFDALSRIMQMIYELKKIRHIRRTLS